MQVLCLTIVSSLLGTLDQECGRLQGAGGGFVPVSPLSASGGDGLGVVSIITPTQFDEMLKHRNDSACPAKGFYTYDAFTRAANSFPGFATSGDFNTRKREVAAFLAQTSSETTGLCFILVDGKKPLMAPYAWGYCYIEEQGNPSDYCGPSLRYPCVSGEKYYGRGPFQISYNYNYGEAGEAIGVDLLKKPALVATDATISFKTALWFWMTPQPPKPSCHAVITGNWTPSDADRSAGRLPGYGLITNLIDGGVECGKGKNAKVEDRIGFYKRYCDILGVSYGNNIDCYAQSTFPSLNF